ncbi:LRR_6 domain-containing protein/LRR_8 domain-containing protein [Cephalotus follicularis]|uniref:LRR_6 domain-containing protein/LRR_8 domain-containing protein n=1 Tax=Cephalotus follicularis TaxID=3775 RepID=A0A1Q3CBJ0_CEPFO|nr:LRR_6 domain-containing protein/LRR_8 domain-containing protein [Cephalotus follicularis]
MNIIMSISTHAILFLLVLCLCAWCNHGEAETDAAPMEEGEKAALYSTIQGFVGNWWNGSDLYPDPCGWTPIQGVSCDLYDDGQWYVTALSIGPVHDNSLECATNVEFREQLFELKHLKSLSFFSCFISPSQHPTTIHNEKWEKLAISLESLEFRANPGLIGQAPATFVSLIKLQSLVLMENGLTGELPRDIGKVTNLKRLVLAGNGFTGQIPDSIGSLSELLILDLSRNSLSGPLPLTLGGLVSLLKLDLSNNQLNGKLPREIGYLKRLTLFDLRSNKISGGLIKSLQDMNSLEELVLSNNPIGGDLMSLEWQKLQNLVILDLSGIGLIGEVPESMAELKRLRFLGLSDNNLVGSISLNLATLPCVGAIYLNGNNLTGELRFPNGFYGKLGRRFGAWNNPNLCYPVGDMSTSHVPRGVKPCPQEVTLLEPISRNKELVKEKAMVSIGLSSYGSGGFWLVFVLQLLVWFNCYL